MSDLYILKHAMFGFIKVGNSVNPKRRCNEIKRLSGEKALPQGIYLWKVYPGLGRLDDIIWSVCRGKVVDQAYLLSLSSPSEWYWRSALPDIRRLINFAHALERLEL